MAEALGRVRAVEGIAILGDAGRLRGLLLMDELGSEGRRHRTMVDALSGLSADVGGRSVQTPPDRARPLLDGWATTQRGVEGGEGIAPNETLVFVIDLVSATTGPTSTTSGRARTTRP